MARARKALAVAVATATAIIMTPGAGEATSPGRPGALAYVGGTDASIYSDRLVSGTVVTKRLSFGRADQHPRWSQDGRKLAYGTLARNIVVMNPDGSGKKTVSFGRSWHPNWMPVPGQPSRVGYVKVTAGRGDIYTVPATGGTPKRVTTDGAKQCGNSQPAWSADGRYFAYVQGIRTATGCTGYRLVVITRATAAKRSVQNVLWPEDGVTRLGVGNDRIDFTADSRSLWFALSGDTDCFETSGIYYPATGRVEVVSQFSCEGESGLPYEEVPAPTGSVWTNCDPYTDECWIGTPSWTKAGTGPGGVLWSDFDMQPLR